MPDSAHSDPVHYYTATGTEAFANQVLSCLVPYLETDKEIVYKEELYIDEPIGI